MGRGVGAPRNAGDDVSMTADEIKRIVAYQVETLGPRACGSRGSHEAFAFLKKEVRAYGYDTDEQTFAMRAARIHRLDLRIGEAPFYALPYFGCPPFYPYTQDISLEAPLVVSSPSSVQGKRARDERALLLADIEDTALERQILAHRRAGYGGVIFISPRETDDDLVGLFSSPQGSHLAELASWTRFAVVCVSRETGERLRRGAARGVHVRLDVGVSSETVTARNLRVRRRGAVGESRANVRVRVVCHYDSAFEAPGLDGASDNASGVAVLLSVLHDLSRRAACPHDVEFVFYDAEEYLLFGALSLLVDLEGERAKRRTWSKLHDALASRAWGEGERSDIPEHFIEIDTVGCGRTLRYGTDTPHAVGKFLRARDLGGAFAKVSLSQTKGNVAYAAARIGVRCAATEHFLTLGAGRRAHTRRDDMGHINAEDMAAVANFLSALVSSL